METFVEEITCFSEQLVEVEWVTIPGQIEKIVLPNQLSVEIINNAPRSRVSNFHIHLRQSKHNATGVSEWHRRA